MTYLIISFFKINCIYCVKFLRILLPLHPIALIHKSRPFQPSEKQIKHLEITRHLHDILLWFSVSKKYLHINLKSESIQICPILKTCNSLCNFSVNKLFKLFYYQNYPAFDFNNFEKFET
jgi:hypothetical protein